MSKEDRKAAARAWKERKSEIGVFAIRCAPAGLVWVGATPTPDAAKNKIWFSLSSGGCPNRAAVEAWKTHGAEAFEFELLERAEWDEAGSADPAYVRNALLKERAEHWRDALGASPF